MVFSVRMEEEDDDDDGEILSRREEFGVLIEFIFSSRLQLLLM